MPTLDIILGIPESMGWESPLLKEIKEGDLQRIAEVDNLLQSVGRHGRGAREGETLLVERSRVDLLFSVRLPGLGRSYRTNGHVESLKLSGNYNGPVMVERW
jgi:hypothetical protein